MIIGVTGGKGGTGKSTIATALAFELQKKNKVLLVDADADCPNDHLILGIKRKLVKKVYQRIPKWDFEKCTKCGLCGNVCKTKAIVAIKRKYPIFIQQQCNGCGACLVKCPVNAISWDKKVIGYVYKGKKKGITLVSSELQINEPLSEFVVNSVKDFLERKKNDFDYIIVDTAAGTHCDVISALQGCDFAIAVTEPTPLGAHDLELIMKLITKLKIPFEVIVNMYQKKNEGLVKKILNKYNKRILAKIPYKKEIMEAYSKGKPIQDKSIDKIIKYIKK